MRPHQPFFVTAYEYEVKLKLDGIAAHLSGTITKDFHDLEAGDEIKIESTPEHGVTVSDVYQLVAGDRDPERIARVLSCPELPEEMRTQVSGYNK